ncbi:MAG: DUF59 domain-containing protein, partial [Acidimicrobiia bacterium]|nr:DUF59 domain-containing protein [Acidimicrobiia bacterium]
MASESEVRAALRGVEEPQLGRSIVELGMVKGVTVRDGLALVDLALPLDHDRSTAELRERTEAAVSALGG